MELRRTQMWNWHFIWNWKGTREGILKWEETIRGTGILLTTGPAGTGNCHST